MQTAVSTNGLKKPLEDWSQINWRKVAGAVKNLRQRIFHARKLGNFRKLSFLAEVDAKKLRKLTTVSSTYHSDQYW